MPIIPIILAIWEAEIEGLLFNAGHGAKKAQDPI
jgi:hypothetical protein